MYKGHGHPCFSGEKQLLNTSHMHVILFYSYKIELATRQTRFRGRWCQDTVIGNPSEFFRNYLVLVEVLINTAQNRQHILLK